MSSQNFLQRLFAEVWNALDSKKIADFYHPNVKAEMGNQIASYQDIVHRCDYVKAHYHKLDSEIVQSLVDGDRVIGFIKQTMLPKHGGAPEIHHILVVYHLEAGKVISMKATIDPAINYFE